MSDWCILRTSGKHTLDLASTLALDGYSVWTPSRTQGRRLPRTRAQIEIPAPLLPSFVFAAARYVSDLLVLSDIPRKRQPDFSVFHYMRRIPLILDSELAGLRNEEARAIPKNRRRHLAKNDVVRIEDGAFAGMSGIVQYDSGKYAMVLFGGMAVKIATFLLRPDEKRAA